MAAVRHSPILSAIPDGVLLRLRMQPGARAERLDGMHDHALRLRLTPPPV